MDTSRVASTRVLMSYSCCDGCTVRVLVVSLEEARTNNLRWELCSDFQRKPNKKFYQSLSRFMSNSLQPTLDGDVTVQIWAPAPSWAKRTKEAQPQKHRSFFLLFLLIWPWWDIDCRCASYTCPLFRQLRHPDSNCIKEGFCGLDYERNVILTIFLILLSPQRGAANYPTINNDSSILCKFLVGLNLKLYMYIQCIGRVYNVPIHARVIFLLLKKIFCVCAWLQLSIPRARPYRQHFGPSDSHCLLLICEPLLQLWNPSRKPPSLSTAFWAQRFTLSPLDLWVSAPAQAL